ncbi:hypothetical protein ACOBQJ_05280 [Pelotomaculum propionicicum]|uniref:hypothetical protein n=1 Tax=Pelotomaculum propionicicum TaxID=258475 RepID=UPI003B80825C
MRKILIITLLLCLSLCAGCSALQQPAPAPEPTPSVVPETSKLGFSPVDLNKAPDVIKNIASDISKREAATWAQVNGTNYILASVGENTKYKVEITDVIQKVPAQDFILIEVKGKYVDLKEGEKGGQVTAISLNPPNRTINGAGFEIVKAAAAAPTTPAPTTQTPAPAAQKPKTTPTAPTPAPTTEQGKTTTEQTKKTPPSETNGENSNSR